MRPVRRRIVHSNLWVSEKWRVRGAIPAQSRHVSDNSALKYGPQVTSSSVKKPQSAHLEAHSHDRSRRESPPWPHQRSRPYFRRRTHGPRLRPRCREPSLGSLRLRVQPREAGRQVIPATAAASRPGQRGASGGRALFRLNSGLWPVLSGVRCDPGPDRGDERGERAHGEARRALLRTAGRASARPPAQQAGGGNPAAPVLEAPYPRRGGSRRACPVLPHEPGEARIRRTTRGLAVFVDPPGDRGGAMVGCVISRTDVGARVGCVISRTNNGRGMVFGSGNGACEHAPYGLLVQLGVWLQSLF